MFDLIFKMDYRIVHFVNAHLRNRFFDYLNIALTYLGSDVFALGLLLALVFLPQDVFRPFAIHAAITLTIGYFCPGFKTNFPPEAALCLIQKASFHSDRC